MFLSNCSLASDQTAAPGNGAPLLRRPGRGNEVGRSYATQVTQITDGTSVVRLCLSLFLFN